MSEYPNYYPGEDFFVKVKSEGFVLKFRGEGDITKAQAEIAKAFPDCVIDGYTPESDEEGN